MSTEPDRGSTAADHAAAADRADADPAAPWLPSDLRVVYEAAPWLRIDLAEVRKPSGRYEQHHRVSLPSAALVVVLDDLAEHVLLAWRHRWVPDVWSWEIIGGLVEDGEEPAETAARELAEEAGYRARRLEHMTTYEPDVGSVRSPHHVYLARGVDAVAGGPTEHDEGRFQWVPLADVLGLITRGLVRSSGALIGLLSVLADRNADP